MVLVTDQDSLFGATLAVFRSEARSEAGVPGP